MRLTIAEPYLRSRGGHCLDYLQLVAQEATKAGLEVTAAIDAAADPDVEAALAFPVIRAFRKDNVDEAPNRISGLGAILKAVVGESAAARMRKAIFGAPGSENERLDVLTGAFAEDTRTLVDRLGLSAPDRLYFPTVSCAEAASVAQVAGAMNDRGPQFSVCLRFDPPEHEPARRRLAYAAGAANKVAWFADTRELAESYSALLDRPVQRIRIPTPYERLRSMAIRRAAPPPVRAIFLGEARREKGYHLLPDPLRNLVGRCDGPDIRFRVQALKPTPGDVFIAAANKHLRALAGERLELIEGPLDRPAFEEALADSHILLLPYDAEAYARRSSGLLVEGLASGIAIVAPTQPSWLTRTIEEERAFDRTFLYDPGAMEDAIVRAARWALSGPHPVPPPPRCATARPVPWEV